MPNPTPTIFVPYHAVDDLHRIGVRSLQPVATAVTPGTLYCVTDEGNKVERSSGLVWQAYGSAGGGVHAPTHVHDGTDPITGELHLSGVTAGWGYFPGTLEVGGQIEAGSIIATDAYFNSLGTTPLNASQLTTGTIQDARLPSSVPLKHQVNTFTTIQQIITGFNYAALYFRDASASCPLWYIGSSGGDLYISDNDLGTAIKIDKVGRAVELFEGKLRFPSTQKPSTDAYTFDDYREGNWTPAITPGAGSGITYAGQEGKYVKVGKLVTCTGYFSLASLGTASGAVNISGLPFPAQNIASAYAGATIMQWSGFATPWVNVWGLIIPSGSYMILRGCQSASTSNSLGIQISDLTSGASFVLTFQYLANA